MKRNIYDRLLLLVVPCFIIIAIILLRNAYGPVWLGLNNDPESIHFYNALTLLQHFNIGNVDNPGTTMQLMMAAFAPIIYLFRFTSKPFWEDIALNFDKYVLSFFSIIIFINALLIFLFGKIIYKYKKSMLLALSLQALFIILIDVLISSLSKFGIEILLFSIVFIVILIILSLWYSPSFAEKEIKFSKNIKFSKYILFLGLACGAGLALKVTFVPIILFLFFVIKGYRNNLLFCIIFFITFAIITIPIWDKLYFFIQRVTIFSSGSGNYGSGKSFFINPIDSHHELVELLKNNIIYFISIILLLAILFFFHLRKQQKNIPKFIYKCSFGLLILFLFLIILLLKNPKARYIQPILYLTPLNFLAIYEILKSQNINLKKYLISFYLLVGLLLLFSIYQLREYRYINKKQRDIQLSINNKLETKYHDKIKIASYRSSSPASAFYLNMAVGNFLDYSYLKKYFPNYYYYDYFTGKYLYWNGFTDLQSIIDKYGKENIIFFCSPLEYTPEYFPKVNLEILEKNYLEVIYKIK